jgi:hypothetical protein
MCCSRNGGNPKARHRGRAPKTDHFQRLDLCAYLHHKAMMSTTMEEKESFHLEIKEGTGLTGEGVWKDAGPIHLLDNPQQLNAAAHDGAATETTTSPSSARAIPKEAKEWLLSNNSVKTKRDRQNLYLFRNAPNGCKNTNLLILLHGAGDSHRPFDKLAQTMSLSHTATLSIHSRVCGIELPFGLGMSWFQELDYNSGNALPRHIRRAKRLCKMQSNTW